MIAGVDGYKGRWIAVLESAEGECRVEVVDDIADLLRRDVEIAVIDIPIGLLANGTRACDHQARRFLGPRRNSIFTAPIRPILAASSHAEASRLRYEVENKRCTIQAFSILPLIRAVDYIMTPDLQGRIREGHPELSFAEMAGRPMAHHKSKSEGRAERIELLRAEFPGIDDRIREFGRPGAVVDIIDAHALLWTARRLPAGTARVIPAEPQVDPRGLRAEMVF